MRVLVAGFQHETNSFAATPADWAAFERGDFFPRYARGAAMLARHRSGGLPTAGFVAEAERVGWTIVPSCWAGASPSAPVTRDAFERVRSEIRADILASGPLDAVYLDLHGAAVCEHLDAPEAELVAEMRSLVGDAVPIVVSCDSHANIDDGLLEKADIVVAYRTYPHVDMVETGAHAFRALRDRLASGTRPRCASRRIPFLIPIVTQSTLQDPAASVYRLLAELETRYGGSPSFATGFPAADVPHCGPTVWAYGDNADMIADALEASIVANATKWRPDLLSAADAVERALELATASDGPVIIADVQDNPGAGADANTTGLLHELLLSGAGRRWPRRVALGLLCDPSAAEAAAKEGVGAKLTLRLGKSVKAFDGQPTELPVEGCFTVRAVHDGHAVLQGPMMTGAEIHAGASACLEMDGLLIAVSSAKTQMLDRCLYRMVGIEPEAMKLLVNKSAVHFRADFSAIAAHILLAKSSGPMAADPAELPWRRLRAGVSPRI